MVEETEAMEYARLQESAAVSVDGAAAAVLSAEHCRGSARGRSEGGGGGSNAISDEQMKQETGITREDHGNRNKFNE